MRLEKRHSYLLFKKRHFSTNVPRSSSSPSFGDTLYVSGKIGFDLHTGQIPKDFDAAVKACLDKIGIVLKAAGMDYSNVVSAQVFLTDITQFKRMNAVYASVFKTPRPARVTVGVAALAVPTAHVEIMVTAQRQASKN